MDLHRPTGSVCANGSPKWISEDLRDPFWKLAAQLDFHRLRLGKLIPKQISEGLIDPFWRSVAQLELHRLRLGKRIPKMDL